MLSEEFFQSFETLDYRTLNCQIININTSANPTDCHVSVTIHTGADMSAVSLASLYASPAKPVLTGVLALPAFCRYRQGKLVFYEGQLKEFFILSCRHRLKDFHVVKLNCYYVWHKN